MNTKILKATPQTEDSHLTKLNIVPAVTVLPKWFKDKPQFQNNEIKFKLTPQGNNLTFKKCVPLLDALSCGYTLVLEEDVLVINENDNITFKWNSGKVLITFQDNESPNIPEEYYQSVPKWMNFYNINTPNGYSLLAVHPLNRIELPFYTLSGVIDTDNFNTPINFPFYIKKNFEGIIKTGTPLVQLIPFKRENWNIEEGQYNPNQTKQNWFKFYEDIKHAYKNQSWSKKTYQ